ncbi:hypothetical protein CLV30_11240 [Haloactinopolyspora alba]|uniref:Polyketide cyclase/dehydrase/lipid transport protein n=1 Tax=Haloactinopolyspora alba TaxID=648780 RepID=A0A2P8DX54_9ACTN|nr:hypothetical protein [Haloactinopolyspora alba]PSL01801.1 hypothetical protein CLV30_11240 [Haloactinopolyspora alba]
MKDETALRTRRVEVTDPIATARRYDYTDAFEVRLPAPDPHPPETWLRGGISESPPWARRITSMLGFSEWQVIESGPDVVHLEMSLPLSHVVLVGRKVEPTRRTLTTALTHQRPVLSRLVWALIGPAHRRSARQIVTSSPDRGENPGHHAA